MNRQIAEVLGWTNLTESLDIPGKWFGNKPFNGSRATLPDWRHSIADAMGLLKDAAVFSWQLSNMLDGKRGSFCIIGVLEDPYLSTTTFYTGETPTEGEEAEAICRAFLKAKGVK